MKLLLLVSIMLATLPSIAQEARHDAAGNLIFLGASNADAPTVRGLSSRLVQPGKATSLSCAATGQNLQYRWFFNGNPVPGATGDTLLLENVSAQNVGDYYVVVGNGSGSATSTVARVELDSDRDGLGDTWELTNFGSLTNQNWAMDPDNDQVPNGLEFQDGTSPTNRLSLSARLEISTFGGRVAVAPDAEVYRTNDLVTLTAIPDPGLSFITWSGALTGPTNPASLRLTGPQQVQATFGLPLAFALNTTNPVTTGGAGAWYGQANVTRDQQAAAAVAPPLAGSGDPFMETTIVMKREGTVSFQWRADGEDNSALEVRVNGRLDFPLSRRLLGATGWQSKTLYLPAGTNRLRWTYIRNGGGWVETSALTKPHDTAYVDQLVVTEYADPLLDSDGNGLPDLWEYRYFDQIGNDPNADPDADGVATRLELTDVTDPSRADSVKPRVSYLIEGQGTAAASPSLSVYSYGQYATNIATPANGWRFIGWVGPFGNSYFLPRLNTNNPSSDRLYTAKTFRAVFGTPPGEAADAPGLTWTTSPTLPWYGQSLISHDGTSAAQSALTVEQWAQTESWLETGVTGPGTLSFFWKASSAAPQDYLALLVDAAETTERTSGLTDWQPVVMSLPAGEHTLRWLFKRAYGYDTNALNTVWLDQVQFTPGATRPDFIELPSALQGYETRDLTFRAVARGTPPVSYQVFRNGVPLSQPTTNVLVTVAAVTPAMAGNWVVRAQNATGSTDSAPIPVSILALPPNDRFANATVLVDATHAFTGYTIGASAETGEPAHDGYTARASTWHRWTAPVTGSIRFTAVATNPPSSLRLAAYRGGSLTGLTEVAANSAYAEVTNNIAIAHVEIQWLATAGVSYSIAVDAGIEGTYYQLSWAAIPPPPNDAFAGRIPLTGGSVIISGDNSQATAEPGEPPIMSFPPFFYMYASNTLWWSWTAPASGTLRLEQQPDQATALVSIFTGNTLSSLTRVLDPLSGQTSLSVVQGVTYSISADSSSGDTGHFTFRLTMDGFSTPELLKLRIAASAGSDTGQLAVTGPAQRSVIIQFSPNLRDWYPWSTNTIPGTGVLNVSLDPPQFIPPAQKRYFRAYAP